MRRALALTIAALSGALLTAPVAESAAKPRFTVSIEGTQRFEWSIDATRDSRGGAVPCGYKGSGRQVIPFRTARPVTVLVPKGEGLTYGYAGQPFLPAAPGKRQRLIPLVGQETREYEALQAPPAGTCATAAAEERKYFRDCRGTNPFLPNAGVVVMRYRRTMRHKHQAMMYAPVDVLLFPRKPDECDLRLFDLRNYLITQLVTMRYLPLTGGNFERRATTVVQAARSSRHCVDPFGSNAFQASFQTCDRPARPGPVTGEMTVTWKVTFRRAR
jgi:hypothetical protein